MRSVLEARNYSVQVASRETISNAALLDDAIRAFCRDTAHGVGIVYFSGHGMAADQQDWIIPEGVGRNAATESANQRVSTDVSQSIDLRANGLVLFIIDACRDPSDDTTAKGYHAWSQGKVRSGERFIRLFGCSAGEVCHVLRKGYNGKDVSVFTTALARALAPEARNDTLRQVLDAAEKECAAIADTAKPRLDRQRPCFGIASDLSPGTLKLLDDPIFRYTSVDISAAEDRGWNKFEPDRLHCLVIKSEHGSHDAPSTDQLPDKVKDIFLSAGDTIWTGFAQFWNGRQIIDGSVRSVPGTFDPSRVVRAVLPVTEAFLDHSSLENAVRAVVQADLAFFDLTRFEPAVMFLLGIRAACRRGVTICSHGYGWREGQQLADTPFNLSDLQVFSHSDSDATGADPVVERLVEGIDKGFAQLFRQPRYQDLPAYEALRELGPGKESRGTIPWQELVLTLCSFRSEYRESWLYIRRRLEAALQERGAKKPRVRRLIDLGSAQLISQALYEQIRRVSACVMDWSLFSPSSFMEIGVRLAVSPWGALHLVDERFLPGHEKALHIKDRDGRQGPELQQLTLMNEQLKPLPYRTGVGRSFKEAVDSLVSRKPGDEANPEYNWIYRVVKDAIEPVSIAYPSVHEELLRSADGLSSAQDNDGSAQILFSSTKGMTRDRERAALEQRIAAWLYLEYRLKAGLLPADDPLRKRYWELGELAEAALYDSGLEQNFGLAAEIRKRLDGGNA